MAEEKIECFAKAKEIYDKVELFSKDIIKEGVKVLDLAERVEEKIKELGGKLAFPINIGINEIAAHYTPDLKDDYSLKKNDLVKVDIGIHVNGWIYDGAFSVDLSGKTNPLIKTAEEAVQEAIEIARPGIKVMELSEVIENRVSEAGFKVIRNLSGHGLDKYDLHSEPTIPNVKNNISTELKHGQTIAIEVFTTNGSGWVKDSKPYMIFQFLSDKPVRNWEARKILEMSKKEFYTLPFCKRWIKGISPAMLDMHIENLLKIEAIHAFPILKEETGSPVAQHERSIIIGESI